MSGRARTSELLSGIAARANPHIAIGELCDSLGDRAFGILLLILALLTCIPSVPGVSGILGGAIMLVAGQIVIGGHRPWLPRFVRDRRLSGPAMRAVVERAQPVLRRLERICRPRLDYMTTGPLERLTGVAVLLLGLVICLPIPFFGNLPPALAIVVLAVGFIEGDGLAVAVGLAVAFAAVILTSALTVAALSGLSGLIVGWLANS